MNRFIVCVAERAAINIDQISHFDYDLENKSLEFRMADGEILFFNDPTGERFLKACNIVQGFSTYGEA